MSFLAVVAVAGQELLFVRSWNEYVQSGRFGLARGALAFGMKATLLFGTGLAVVTAGSALFGAPAALAIGASLFLLTQAVLLFSSHAARTVVGIFTGEFNREISWRLFAIAAALAAPLLAFRLDAASLFFLSAAGIALAVAVHAVAVTRHIPAEVAGARPETDVPAWSRRAFMMWVASVLESASQYLDVIVLGLFLNPAVAGGYFVASRLASLLTMAASGLNIYSSRTIATLYYSGDKAGLRRLLRSLALIILALVAGCCLVILGGGNLLLSFFGSSYLDQYGILAILLLGTAVSALAGPAPAVLLLTGQEGVYCGITAAGLIVRCSALAVLITSLGNLGAAIASTGSVIATALALNYACRKLVAVDPSVAILLSRRREPPTT
jgi:O-antigen/teichoic acid export membrane protein